MIQHLRHRLWGYSLTFILSKVEPKRFWRGIFREIANKDVQTECKYQSDNDWRLPNGARGPNFEKHIADDSHECPYKGAILVRPRPEKSKQ